MLGGDSVCDGDSFAVFQPHPHAWTARVDEEIHVRVTGLRLRELPVYYLSFPVTVVGVEDRPPTSAVRCAIARRLSSGVTLVSPVAASYSYK